MYSQSYLGLLSALGVMFAISLGAALKMGFWRELLRRMKTVLRRCFAIGDMNAIENGFVDKEVNSAAEGKETAEDMDIADEPGSGAGQVDTADGAETDLEGAHTEESMPWIVYAPWVSIARLSTF